MSLNDAFLLFFKGLARNAPGDDEATLRALAACDLPDDPVVYDLGAGTGSSTLVLAEELESVVVAIDRLDQSLTELQTRAERRKIDAWVDARVGDFMALDAAEKSIDLIWCEGSIYAAGWEQALATWRPLMCDGGYLVVTDCVWATDDPPSGAVEFWNREYPSMKRAPQIRELVAEVGFEVIEQFPLPAHAWSNYYGPLAQRVALVESSDASDDMQQVAAMVKEEIDVWEAFGHAVDYTFFVLRLRAA